MYNVGAKVKWEGAEVTILAVDAMNTTKGVRRMYSFISPTGNYITGITGDELTT